MAKQKINSAALQKEIERRLLQKFPEHHHAKILEFAKDYIGSLGDVEKRKTAQDQRFLRFVEPIDIFVENEYYLGKEGQVYPNVMQTLKDICHGGDYEEVVLTGGIGSAKTTIALYLQAYQLYILSCIKNPQIEFGLDSSSEILIVFQSLNKELAKNVDYKRFRDMIGESPYFQKHFMFNKDLESSMVFPNRIEVRAVAGTETAAIGQNVIGGIIDEINYMAVVDRSMMSVDRGTFDQALALYNSIARRRESRFFKGGKMPGLLCLVSSKRYPGQFTDRKEEESKKQLAETGKTSIYIYDRRVWEVKPEGTFSNEWFEVFVGDATRRPRVMKEDEFVDPEDRHLVTRVPVEFKKNFDEDIINALREIAGVSTMALYPFMLNTNAVAGMFGLRESIFDSEVTDFVSPKLAIIPSLIKDRREPRFCHIDLAVSGDSCGFCIGYVKKFVAVESQDGEVEVLPEIHIDGCLEIRPPQGGEIEFAKIRTILYTLQKLGMPIKWVTFDSFQSVDSIQILRRKGFISDVRSVDRTPIPYELTKSAFYTNRLLVPKHDKCYMEMVSLERDPKSGKIDHPPHLCFSGDTEIELEDGTSISFEGMVSNPPSKRCLSYNISTGEVEKKPIVAPRVTAYVANLVEVELENGEVIRCTPGHRFLLTTGVYKKAKCLTEEDEIQT